MSYNASANLNDNEKLAKINIETGEIKEINISATRKPRDKSMDYFNSKNVYQRYFTKAWGLLMTQTNDLEFRAATMLGMMAKAYTNSLEPLNPDSTAKELSDYLHIDRRLVLGVMTKLEKLGVIGTFGVYNRNEVYQGFWIFNPYLSFNGKIIKKDVDVLFKDTYYNM